MEEVEEERLGNFNLMYARGEPAAPVKAPRKRGRKGENTTPEIF